MKIGLVVPHIFMQRAILPHVIFSPGQLALSLAEGLVGLGHEVRLYTPGAVDTKAENVTADLQYFEAELALRGDTYMDLLKKHPLVFITLARQVQSELIAKAYADANNDELDVVHIYTNEEDTALPFAAFCSKQVVFTHHDPYNFLAGYRSLFPKYKQLPWISLSLAQRKTMPADTNWLANVYHGLDPKAFYFNEQPSGEPYIAYCGRIIEPKGVLLAILAVQDYNRTHQNNPLKLKIAGKHYAGATKDTYWQRVEPLIDGETIQYVGFLKEHAAKQDFFGNARGLIIPSVFEEPFGMVMVEALACGTPIIGLDSGAIPEVIEEGLTGFVIKKNVRGPEHGKIVVDEAMTGRSLAKAFDALPTIQRQACRQQFEKRFSLERMCNEHISAYRKALQNH